MSPAGQCIDRQLRADTSQLMREVAQLSGLLSHPPVTQVMSHELEDPQRDLAELVGLAWYLHSDVGYLEAVMRTASETGNQGAQEVTA